MWKLTRRSNKRSSTPSKKTQEAAHNRQYLAGLGALCTGPRFRGNSWWHSSRRANSAQERRGVGIPTSRTRRKDAWNTYSPCSSASGSLYQPVIRGRSRPVRATTSDSISEDREKFATNLAVPTSVRDPCDIEYFSPFLLLLPPPALATISRSPPPLIHQDFRCPPRLRDVQYHL